MRKKFLRILSLAMALTFVFSSAVLVNADEETKEIGEFTPFRISATIKGDSSSSRGFTWYTKSNTGSVIDLWTDTEATVSGPQYNVDYEDVFEWEGNWCHKATVTGLQPGVKYTYTVGNEAVKSAEGHFVTDNKDNNVSFVVVADIQAGNLDSFTRGAATIDAAFRTLPDAEFMVNCGDFTNDSDNEEWNYYDTAMSALNLSTTLAPVAGNHDGLGVWHWFENMFNLDTSESVQNLNGVNYSFDYGNAHIAVLNTNDVLSISLSQLKWLKNDMNSTDKDWKIVFMHKTPYTLGKDGKWPDALYLQKSLTKICDECNVDLVMSGHDHQYLRTKPLTNNKVSENGTTYILSGTAGTKRYEVRPFLAPTFLKTEFIDALTIQKNGYGNYWDGESWNNTKQENIGGCFNCIEINGTTLTLNSYILSDEMTDGNNERLITNHDSFTITKNAGENKITYTGDNTTSEFEFYLGVVPSFCALAAYTFSNWLPKFLYKIPDIARTYIEDDIF